MARGRVAYSEGRFEEALKSFEAAIWPRRARLSLDTTPRPRSFSSIGMPQARERYQEARVRADRRLANEDRLRSRKYVACPGEKSPRRSRSYDDCLGSTAGGRSLDLVRQDAEINRRFAIEQAQAPAIAESENPDEPVRLAAPKTGGEAPIRAPDGDDTSAMARLMRARAAGTNSDADENEERNRQSNASSPNRRGRGDGKSDSGKSRRHARGSPRSRPSSTSARQRTAVAFPKSFLQNPRRATVRTGDALRLASRLKDPALR